MEMESTVDEHLETWPASARPGRICARRSDEKQRTARSKRSIFDRTYAKPFLRRIRDNGWDAEEVQRFVLVPAFIAALQSDATQLVRDNFSLSQSQFLQDLFVLITLNQRRNGYFVEIGVGDGKKLSNTYLLEKTYDWTGILAEPHRAFAKVIPTHRSSILDNRAVFSSSGRQLEFLADATRAEHSTLKSFADGDGHSRGGNDYLVETITLDDLLDEHGAPDIIEYISIDTEGSELEILRGLDLDKRRVDIFTIEINDDMEKFRRIEAMLIPRGYRTEMSKVSACDAWFVHHDAGA